MPTLDKKNAKNQASKGAEEILLTQIKQEFTTPAEAIQLAAQVRKVRPPNAYKEKGIRYSDEVLHFKPGKAAARKA